MSSVRSESASSLAHDPNAYEMSGYVPPGNDDDSFCRRSSVDGAPDETSMVTLGCSFSNSSASPVRIVWAWSASPVHHVRVTSASLSRVVAPGVPEEQADTRAA